MKKKVEKYCLINDEKIDVDIEELRLYITILMKHLSKVSDPKKYKRMLTLKREAQQMIDELEEKKLLNREKSY